LKEAKAPAADLLANARAALDWAASVKGGPAVARDVASACVVAAEVAGRDPSQAAEGVRLARACRDAYFTAPTAEIDRQYAARLAEVAGQRP